MAVRSSMGQLISYINNLVRDIGITTIAIISSLPCCFRIKQKHSKHSIFDTSIEMINGLC